MTEMNLLQGEAVSSIHVNMKLSSQHVEVNLSELEGYEKHVIVELIKEKSNKLSNNALLCNHDNCRGTFKSLPHKDSTVLPNNTLSLDVCMGMLFYIYLAAIILYEADKLSTDALLYIRWLLERYKGCKKVFFCCNDISKLQPIKSLCRVVNLLPPSNKEVTTSTI